MAPIWTGSASLTQPPILSLAVPDLDVVGLGRPYQLLSRRTIRSSHRRPPPLLRIHSSVIHRPILLSDPPRHQNRVPCQWRNPLPASRSKLPNVHDSMTWTWTFGRRMMMKQSLLWPPMVFLVLPRRMDHRRRKHASSLKPKWIVLTEFQLLRRSLTIVVGCRWRDSHSTALRQTIRSVSGFGLPLVFYDRLPQPTSTQQR